MLAITDIDVFSVMNGLFQRYPTDKQPKLYFGLSSYFATSPQREHAVVLDAALKFTTVEPAPQFPVKNGVIDWDMIDAYLETPRKKLPLYSFKRVDIVEDILKKAADNDKHALSAMLSNFTPAVRPKVRERVIEFLKDPKSTKFELPDILRPKRGRAVDYYNTASNTDFSALKRDIQYEAPQSYEGRYWRAIIHGKPKKTKGGKRMN
jgi:hypothetical protein